MEGALCHSREDVNHGINPVLLRLLRKGHHAEAVGHELSVEESIHHVELADDVDQAKCLANPVPQRVGIVSLKKK